MIATLTGRLRRKAADYLVVDVSGVGYQVQVPLSTFYALGGEGEEVSLYIHTHLREDALALFGFSTPAEKDLFLLLIGVSGIGPKLALSVLSSLSVEELARAIQTADDSRLHAIPGVGKKTAARLVLELKDKVKTAVSSSTPESYARDVSAGNIEDALSALVNLGYKKPFAEAALKKISQSRPGIPLENLIREALSLLVKK